MTAVVAAGRRILPRGWGDFGFQIVLWVFVIGGATAYVMALSGNLVPLTEGTLALLGISGIATLASQVKANEAERPEAEPISLLRPPGNLSP